MKHKRHQKDRRDRDERPHRHKDEDHRYISTELKSSEYSTVYKMKESPDNFDENSSHPKKLIIYIVKSLFNYLKCV